MNVLFISEMQYQSLIFLNILIKKKVTLPVSLFKSNSKNDKENDGNKARIRK